MVTARELPVARAKSSKRFELLLDPQFLSRIEHQAGRFGMNPSTYMRLAITEKVERDEGTSATAAVDAAMEKAEELKGRKKKPGN